MTNKNDDYIASSIALFGEKERQYQALRAHVLSIIKDRSIIFTADTDHLAAISALKCFQNIDKPKNYDFQDDDHHEAKFIRLLMNWYMPVVGYELRSNVYKEMTPELIQSVIAGDSSITFECNGYDKGCYDCNKKMSITIEGNRVHFFGAEPCSHNRTFSVEVDFPTGELVFSDWPYRFSEAKSEGFIVDKDFDINKLMGQRQSTESYATNNKTFFASVGNTSPTLYVTGNGEGTGTKIRIGKGGPGFKDVGYFCTDLWWTTIIDKKFYDQIMERLGPDEEKRSYRKEVKTTKVKPGRYRFTIVDRYTDYDEYHDDSGELYSFAEWIGPSQTQDFPFPKRELMEWNEVCQTMALLHVPDNHTFKPDYKYNPVYNSHYAADHIFNVLGNGLNTMGDLLDSFAKENVRLIPEKYHFPDENITLKTPYPNFEKQYSVLWEIDVTLLPKSWVMAAISYYTDCALFFKEGAKGYHNAYPYKDAKTFEQVTTSIMNQKDKFKTEEEWFKYIEQQYSRRTGVSFTGDIDAFCKARWEQERQNSIAFCEETIHMLLDKCFDGDMEQFIALFLDA